MNKFKFKDSDNIEVTYYKWVPKVAEVKGIVQIVHGMTEHAKRYDYFASKLNDEGYIVYANDHRGHGESIVHNCGRGYIADKDGFDWMVKDVKELSDIIKEENQGKSLVLIGHSMGSFISQRYIEQYGKNIDGVILSGTNGKPLTYTKAGIVVSKVEMSIRGRKAKSKLMDKLSFGNFNSTFKPNRTSYDWLCSVDEEVDRYIDDEKCGFICSTSFYYDLLKGLWEIHKKENLNNIPKDLPIYIFAGDKDPVGYSGKGIVNLFETYKGININDVKYKLYKDGRHEMLNEWNRDEVISDIIFWIDKKIVN